MITKKQMEELRNTFTGKLQEKILMANFTTMNVGGPADALLIAHSAEQLADYVSKLWEMNLPVKVLGGGSNLLVSDKGIREVVVINHAHNIKINTRTEPKTVWAESGAQMINVGKMLTTRALSGMEWAATIPGTVGGAVYGNAGAFGQDTQCNLIHADVLHRKQGRSNWTCEQMQFTYRASKLKRDAEEAVILSAEFAVEDGDPEEISKQIKKFRKRRLKNQPPGASVGSIFRNPPEDKAGRLIESVGLKGKKIGGGIISPQHANFIINQGGAKAQDILDLLILARETVRKEHNVKLIPEIEVLGDWDALPEFLKNIHADKAVNK